MTIFSSVKSIGPGIVIAATGLGAGDMIAATIAGVHYGSAILWAAVLGAVLKFTLNEGLVRWQLATNTTLLEGWFRHLPRAVHLYFFFYLFLWSFVVAGAIMVACGIAAHSVFPQLSVTSWGIAHSLIAAALVISGRYSIFETLMKLLIGFMFLVVVICAAQLDIHWSRIWRQLLIPTVPEGSIKFVFGIIGGVGGSVTILCYGYWIRERGWKKPEHLSSVRVDLFAAYFLTAVFAIAIMLIASEVKPEAAKGVKIAVAMADQLTTVIGPMGRYLFLLGFWAAVFSSMLGVWQGIPYLFADSFYLNKAHKLNSGDKSREQPQHSFELSQTTPYRCFLLFLSLPPAVLLFVGKPIWIVILYAVAGAFFMPFLATLLLYMNNRKQWIKDLSTGLLGNIMLVLGLAVFTGLLLLELYKRLGN